MFYVGQKVCCVNDALSEPEGSTIFSRLYGRPVRIEGGLDGLTKGGIYTISGFGVSHDGSLGVHLSEVVRRCPGVPFKADRFRPVVERKTDISIFKAMLEPKTARADA